ncbi:hypothetical protein Moror_11068 [Moniliophthora roreri MCA 2997]|uniref:Uncharacterized protein n=2 Tax=Moniliophthora roreri TaxID=221103 RepID=V2WV36_MONRO|nr:hypothetical protein Moror_11068 [Moniliophthora roreri MCA 2997]
MRKITPIVLPPPNNRRTLFKLGFGRRLNTASEISITALLTLKCASFAGQIPFIGIACTLAVEILRAAQAAKNNKDAFKRLAKDSCSLVLHIKMVCQELSSVNDMKDSGIEGRQILSPMLLKHLEELEETLTEIRDFAKQRASRGFWKRYFANTSDLGRIQEYRERLRQALDIFGIQSQITVCETVARMASQQRTIQEGLRSWGSIERADTSGSTMFSVNEKTNNPFTSSANSTPCSSVPFEDAFKDLLKSTPDTTAVTDGKASFIDISKPITPPIDERTTNAFVSLTSLPTDVEDLLPSPPPYTHLIGSPTVNKPKDSLISLSASVVRTTHHIGPGKSATTSSPAHLGFHVSLKRSIS